uniref:Uncharacterized protein n=1 Tax=Hyaloperonospora arabidopsidis (strain Emoy2) TaxID=559515 RepID=M4B3D2_HYAAE
MPTEGSVDAVCRRACTWKSSWIEFTCQVLSLVTMETVNLSKSIPRNYVGAVKISLQGQQAGTE